MVIKNKNNDELDSLSKWKAGFISVDDKKHWEPGYSAHSLGLFFTSKQGKDWLTKTSLELFGSEVEWDEGRIEHESKLDCYGGRHRMQDLALWGKLNNGTSIFMAIEAKVLESFGNYVLRDEYENAKEEKKKRESEGKSSNKPARVEEITNYFFPGKTPYDKSICNLRYQLMHYFKASILEAPTYGESLRPLSKRRNRVDVVILPILVFKTKHYDENPEKGELNEQDYINFCDAIKLRKEAIGGKEVRVGTIDGRKVITFYEKIYMEEFKITPKKGVVLGRVIDDDFLYGSFSDTDAMVDSDNVEDRLRMARWGYGVDKLKDDPDPRVRAEVARGGYYTQELLQDESPEVRIAAREAIYGEG